MRSPEVPLEIIKITVQLTVLAGVQQIGSSGSNQLSLHKENRKLFKLNKQMLEIKKGE